MTSVLKIQDLSVSLGGRPILEGIDLSVQSTEVFAIMGPGGAGKSSLLHTLGGVFDESPSAEISGGIEIEGGGGVSLVRQNPPISDLTVYRYLAEALPERSSLTRRQCEDHLAGLLDGLQIGDLVDRLEESMLECQEYQRVQLALTRAHLTGAAVIAIDEPMAGLEDRQARPIARLIGRLAQEHAILMVTHHQQRARVVADKVGLLAGGRFREQAPTERFFEAPSSEAARNYVRTGGCSVPSLMADPEEVSPSVDPAADRESDELIVPAPDDIGESKSGGWPGPVQPDPSAPSAARGPDAFHWLLRGYLAGARCPGIFHDLKHDLKALRRVEVDILVTLKEAALDEAVVGDWGIEPIHFPMPDMQSPSWRPTAELLEELTGRMIEGRTVAFHCQAGIGRTGTLLASYLIFHGMSAEASLQRVRKVHRRYVQSESQEAFLHSFEQKLENWPVENGWSGSRSS